ncbi:serine acetyltransferase [Desulfopila sp. IMCC35006]|uniref:DapH/DapD/GlmU-related protein n=1 Tax=Desulfopila sp. IMCC35006 TaxID=2569542 RepID=UPI0010ABF8C8|nr:DapH/DapD/GlmU-related protein [Desulfopila sp. IMCC35006]TKB23952.1 serine acetyltransferase [Desulfopila sp. IMCC35006]
MKRSIWYLKNTCLTGPRLLKPLAKAIYKLFEWAYGGSIPWYIHFESMPCLPHGMHGIFITGKIGKRCTIFQHVTIGYNTLPDSKGFGVATIGDDCYIGAGAVIIGNIKIGNRVRIGANCTVHQDVPDDCIVTTGHQIVVRKGAPQINKYYSYRETGWYYFDEGNWIEEKDEKILKMMVPKR